MMARDHMKLLVEYDPEDADQMEDAAYSGFIPVLARLLEYSLQQGMFPAVVNKRLARKTLLPRGERGTERRFARNGGGGGEGAGRETWPSKAVVMVLGGVTRAELSAMRCIIQRKYPTMEVIFALSSIISGDSIFAELLSPSSGTPSMPPPLEK